ncbi:MAG: TadE/TadG family type IV pilus assembly protein [Pseudomonadota bacterium]
MLEIKSFLKDFARDERGSLAVETVIILPILFWAYLSMFAIFDAYRQHAINQKAAFTIGDIVSRQTTPIDASFLTGMRGALKYLSNSDSSEAAIRITSVRWNENKKEYRRDWSKVQGSGPKPLTNNDVKNWHSRLPVMVHNDRVILVETFVDYDPPFATGLQNRTIENFVFTKPRYAPQVLWQN